VFPITNFSGAAIHGVDLNSGTKRAFLGRRTLNASILITTLVVLVKIVSVVKEIVVARRFGAADSLDAFYVALVVPELSRRNCCKLR